MVKRNFVLRLYVTGASPNSSRAISNLRKICDEYPQDKFELEIIDVYQQPHVASKADLVALPLLVKKLPLPEQKLIGDLSDHARVIDHLGLNKEDE